MNLLDADLVVARLLPPDLGVDGAEVCPSSSSVPSSRATRACFRLLEDLNNKYNNHMNCALEFITITSCTTEEFSSFVHFPPNGTAIKMVEDLKYNTET